MKNKEKKYFFVFIKLTLELLLKNYYQIFQNINNYFKRAPRANLNLLILQQLTGFKLKRSVRSGSQVLYFSTRLTRLRGLKRTGKIFISERFTFGHVSWRKSTARLSVFVRQMGQGKTLGISPCPMSRTRKLRSKPRQTGYWASGLFTTPAGKVYD